MANSLQLRSLSACIGVLIAFDVAGGGGPGFVPQGFLPPRHYVTNCDDHGPGSLRDVLVTAASGDSVDLTQLTCSTITLTTGQVGTNVRDISLSGGDVTISAGGASRVFLHLGYGTLRLRGLTFADGMVAEDNVSAGGCIFSHGSVRAVNTTVRNCSVASTPGPWDRALGGGIFAGGNIELRNTSIKDNSIIPTNTHDFARGGGVNTYGNLFVTGSTISGNSIADNAPDSIASNAAGGFYARNSVYIVDSTVSGNSAHFAGGGWFGYSGVFGNESVSTIKNSTISGNSAHLGAGGLVTQDVLLKVWNSTVAFNSADTVRPEIMTCGGIFALGADEYLSFRSSIVANNTLAGVESDVCATPYISAIIGNDNLIIAANQPLPPDTIQSDPMLGPLAKQRWSDTHPQPAIGEPRH